MPFKDKETRRRYDNLYYGKRSTESKSHKVRLQLQRKKEILRITKDIGFECRCCCEDDRDLIEFHHHFYKKNFSIADGVRNGYSLERILKEISRCIPLCANCHTKFHSGRGQTAKLLVLETSD